MTVAGASEGSLSYFGTSSYSDDDTPRFHWMFHQLMGACYLIQRTNFRNIEPPPSRLKCLINAASGFNLCLRWDVITAHKEDFRVHKDELPEWDFRRRRISGVSREGTTLRQNLNIGT